jgi:pimeloyl-[acyl-carrier protein] methyl ester esterase
LNNLFINVAGQGEPLLVLHGWGMNHTIWSPVKQMLEENYTVTWLDLPGHGQNKAYEVDNLEQMVAAVHAICDEGTHVLGWSLGGLIAQHLAYLYPTEIKSLILVATSPSFVQRAGWHHAMVESVLDAFVANLEEDYAMTLKRFLSLQFVGVKGMQSTLKLLREAIVAIPPTMLALRVGLNILKETDLRLQQCTSHKRLWILGEMDRLVPNELAIDLSAMNADDQLHIIKGAGHAPFVSHPEIFSRYVTEFLSHVRS